MKQPSAFEDSGTVKGGKKCNEVFHGAASAFVVMIKNLAVKF